MNVITHLVRPLTSDAFDASVASKLLYAAALLVFVLSVLKVTSLELSEPQLLFGLLLSGCVMGQVMLAGLLLEVHGRLGARQGNDR